MDVRRSSRGSNAGGRSTHAFLMLLPLLLMLFGVQQRQNKGAPRCGRRRRCHARVLRLFVSKVGWDGVLKRTSRVKGTSLGEKFGFGFLKKVVGDANVDWAYICALLRVVKAHALGASIAIDHVEAFAFVNRRVGADGNTSTAIDAVFDDHGGHGHLRNAASVRMAMKNGRPAGAGARHSGVYSD